MYIEKNFQKPCFRRIPWIDVLRGIAILIMIPANFSVLLAGPHPYWFRILSSMAAPLFIMLSTGMVILNEKKYPFNYYLTRGAYLIGFAVLIDVLLWKILPFTTQDMLYLLGFSLPIVYLVREYTTRQLIHLGLIFFLMTYVLQYVFGYHMIAIHVPLQNIIWPDVSRILQSWFIDGWFPIFPWLGYAFFGAVFFRVLFSDPNHRIPLLFVLFGIFALLAGLAYLLLSTMFNTNFTWAIREGSTEVFYPPTLFFMLASLGFMLLFSVMSQSLKNKNISRVICLFGRYSLLIYILHFIMESILIKFIQNFLGYSLIQDPWIFIAIVSLAIIVLYQVCLIVDKIKKYRPPTLVFWQMLFGK